MATAPQNNHQDSGLGRDWADASQDSSKPIQVIEVPKQSFGEHFRSARAEAGLSVEEMAAAGKVREEVILHLEDGTYTQLSIDVFYLTTSVERLCLQLGDEGNAVLEHFQDELEERGFESRLPNNPNLPIPINSSDFNDNSLDPLNRADVSKLPTVITIVIFVLLAVLILAAVSYQKYNARISAQQADQTDFDLPQLISTRHLPLEALPVPSN